MAKMNTEALMKQKFWIALGAFFLLFVLGYTTLTLSAGGPIEAKKKEYADAEKEIKSWTSRAKNRDTFLPPWEKYGKTYRDHKNTIWKEAWEAQKNLLKWPGGDEYAAIWEQSETFADWIKAFGDDDKGGRSSRLRNNYKDKHYLETLFPQRSDAEQKAEPLYVYQLEKELAPVEFKNGKAGFETMMAPATGAIGGGAEGSGPGGLRPGMPPSPRPGFGGEGGPGAGATGTGILTVWGKRPSVEEFWLAQEDYSVKYELLQVVRRTLDSVARLNPFDVKTPLTKGAVSQIGFRNSRWEIVLQIEADKKGKVISKKSTIKNLTPRVMLLSNPRTKGPLVFQLQQGNAKFDLRIKGEPLGAGAQTEIGEQFAVDLIDLARPFQMAQVLDWSTSPIRRIDDIRLGFHSHRTSNQPLIAAKHFEPKEGEADPNNPNPGGFGTPPAGPPGMEGFPPAGGEGMGLPGPTGPSPTTPDNGLVRNRYSYVTGQARSLPIALSVILDQTNLHEFLVELANSQLRFQITQVQIRHVRDVGSQRELPPPPSTPGTGGPLVGGPGSGFPRPPMGPIGPIGSGPGEGSGGLAGQGPIDPNLVELTVYGVATLYEKFHIPKDPTQNTTDAAGANPGQ